MDTKQKFKRIWDAIFIPTSIEPIKFVLLLENILGVYRNIWYYNKKSRNFVYLRIVLELGLIVVCTVMYALYNLPYTTKTKTVFYMTAISSIIVNALAVIYSKRFSKLVTFIESNHNYFANDKEYLKNMLKRDSVIKYVFLTPTVFVLSSYSLMYLTTYKGVSFSVNVVFVLIARLYDYRSVCEHLVLYTFLFVISAHVECITRAISRKNVSGIVIAENKQSRLELTDFEELLTAFSNIKKCSQQLNKIFGRQLVLMLATATIYCILFLYNLAFISVKGFHDLLGLTASLVKLTTFFLPLLLISWGAQQILNNVNNLRYQLGKLLIDCDTNVAYYKAIKGFLHLVSPCSLQTRTFGSIKIDMSFIPSFIMFVTSYTVIALQFNNVV